MIEHEQTTGDMEFISFISWVRLYPFLICLLSQYSLSPMPQLLLISFKAVVFLQFDFILFTLEICNLLSFFRQQIVYQLIEIWHCRLRISQELILLWYINYDLGIDRFFYIFGFMRDLVTPPWRHLAAWMNNHITQYHVIVITYPCHNSNVGLANVV